MPDKTDRSAVALRIVESLADGLAAYDEQFRFGWVNPAAESLLGMKESELLGRSQWEAFPSTLGTPLEAAYRRAMSERVAVEFENFFEARGKWCNVQVRPSGDGGLSVQFHDFTDRKRAEESLRATTLFPEQNPYPVLRVGRDGTLLFANPSAAWLLEDWRCAPGSRVPEVVGRAVETALAEGALKEFEIQSGGRIVSVIVVPLADLDSANLYSRDVTAHRQAEVALRRLNAELEERVAGQTSEIRSGYEALKVERQRLHEVLEMLPAYAVLLSPDYHVPFANRFFRERFGDSKGRRCYEYLFQRTEPCESLRDFHGLEDQRTPPLGVDRPGRPELRHSRLPVPGLRRLEPHNGGGTRRHRAQTRRSGAGPAPRAPGRTGGRAHHSIGGRSRRGA